MALDGAFGRGGVNDRVDTDELLDDIGLDDEEIAWRKRHIDFDEEDAQRLTDLAPVFRDHADEIADRFYENLTPHERTRSIIGRSDKSVEQLKQTQRAYLVTLATGQYDRPYFRNRARVGKVHEVLDMPLHFYIGQYGVYYNLLFELLDDRIQAQVVDAIREWTAEELADRDRGGVGGRLLGALRDDGDYDDEAEALAADLEDTVREEIHDGVEDLLAVLRALNLDMQVAVDTYVDSYSGRLEAAIRERERLAREVQEDVHDPLSDVDTAAGAVAESAQEISALADESSDGVATIADEVSSLGAATQEIAATAEDVSERSRQARDRARESRADAERALATMEDLGEVAASADDDVERLESMLDDFEETVDVVEDVARGTRRLGRQATLESTKRGGNREQFRELADDVKSFADETEAQLETIGEEVATLRSAVEATVDSVAAAVEEVETGVAHVEASMADIDATVDAVEAVTDGVEDVAAAADSQAESVEQVAVAADQAADAAESVAAETDDVAAATEEQTAQVEEVSRTVARLTDEA
jgi:heme-based aerotactic transducer